MNRSNIRSFRSTVKGLWWALPAILVVALAGCSDKAKDIPNTPDAQKSFMGDASKMPADVQEKIRAAQQQGAAGAAKGAAGAQAAPAKP